MRPWEHARLWLLSPCACRTGNPAHAAVEHQKGAGYCYSFDGTTGSQVWGTTGDTYALGGMAIDNGYAVFGNDYNHLYVVHD